MITVGERKAKKQYCFGKFKYRCIKVYVRGNSTEELVKNVAEELKLARDFDQRMLAKEPSCAVLLFNFKVGDEEAVLLNKGESVFR